MICQNSEPEEGVRSVMIRLNEGSMINERRKSYYLCNGEWVWEDCD